MRSLIINVADKLHDTVLEDEDHTSNEELNNLGNPIIDIGRRAFKFYKESILNINTALLHTIESAQEGEEERVQS